MFENSDCAYVRKIPGYAPAIVDIELKLKNSWNLTKRGLEIQEMGFP